jgi:hypothetical protein
MTNNKFGSPHDAQYLPPNQRTAVNGLVGCKKWRLPTYQQTFGWRVLLAWALIIVAFGAASFAILLF